MAYQAGGLIQAADYNNLVNGDPSGSPKPLNLTWGTGSGSAGYGQTAEANVAIGDSVTSSKWAGLVTKTGNAASHQGSSITNVTAPVTGGIVTFLSAIPGTQEIPGNLNTIHSNRLNAASQGDTVPFTATRNTNWNNILTFTFTVTFESGGDAARYFFNAGGQLKLSLSHTNVSDPQNVIVNTLASNMGTIVLSSPIGTATASIGPGTFTGITRVGGSGTPETLLTSHGYYNLSTTPTLVYLGRISGGTYNNSLASVTISSNGTVGSNSDQGSVITIVNTINIDPDNVTLIAPTESTLSVTYPSSSLGLDVTWGTVNVESSVTPP